MRKKRITRFNFVHENLYQTVIPYFVGSQLVKTICWTGKEKSGSKLLIYTVTAMSNCCNLRHFRTNIDEN